MPKQLDDDDVQTGPAHGQAASSFVGNANVGPSKHTTWQTQAPIDWEALANQTPAPPATSSQFVGQKVMAAIKNQEVAQMSTQPQAPTIPAAQAPNVLTVEATITNINATAKVANVKYQDPIYQTEVYGIVPFDKIPSSVTIGVGATLDIEIMLRRAVTAAHPVDPKRPKTTFAFHQGPRKMPTIATSPSQVPHLPKPDVDWEALPRFFRPVRDDPHFYLPRPLFELFQFWAELGARGESQEGRWVGDAGTGKTSAAYKFAYITGRPIVRFQMNHYEIPSELLGQRTLEPDGEGGTRTGYALGVMAQALATRHSIVLADEITTSPPPFSNVLASLLDDGASAYIDSLDMWLDRGEGNCFIGAHNEGAAYHGNSPINHAIIERLTPIEYFAYLPSDVEEQIIMAKYPGADRKEVAQLVRIANDIRALAHPSNPADVSVAPSTRLLLRFFKYRSVGMSTHQGLRWFIGYLFPPDQDGAGARTAIASAIQAQFQGFSFDAPKK